MSSRMLSLSGESPSAFPVLRGPWRCGSLFPVDFGAIWKAAFAYYDPKERLDFSDTGELMQILGLGQIGIKEFNARFLTVEDADTPEKSDLETKISEEKNGARE